MSLNCDCQYDKRLALYTRRKITGVQTIQLPTCDLELYHPTPPKKAFFLLLQFCLRWRQKMLLNVTNYRPPSPDVSVALLNVCLANLISFRKSLLRTPFINDNKFIIGVPAIDNRTTSLFGDLLPARSELKVKIPSDSKKLLVSCLPINWKINFIVCYASNCIIANYFHYKSQIEFEIFRSHHVKAFISFLLFSSIDSINLLLIPLRDCFLPVNTPNCMCSSFCHVIVCKCNTTINKLNVNVKCCATMIAIIAHKCCSQLEFRGIWVKCN